MEDGRSFVRRSAEKYQVIQATLVDTWASTAAGAFALSENNLYTTDAFRDYLSHLTDDGTGDCSPAGASIRRANRCAWSRWPWRALGQLGEKRARARPRHRGPRGSVKGWGAQDTVLDLAQAASAMPISIRARRRSAAANMKAVYYPGGDTHNQFSRFAARRRIPLNTSAHYRFDITPVTDNRPFFFYTVQPRDLSLFMRTASHEAADYKAVNARVPLLFGLMGVSLVATALILMRRRCCWARAYRAMPGRARFLLYFLFIGDGLHSDRSRR